jgi:hypothetical protein
LVNWVFTRELVEGLASDLWFLFVVVVVVVVFVFVVVVVVKAIKD